MRTHEGGSTYSEFASKFHYSNSEKHIYEAPTISEDGKRNVRKFNIFMIINNVLSNDWRCVTTLYIIDQIL